MQSREVSIRSDKGRSIERGIEFKKQKIKAMQGESLEETIRKINLENIEIERLNSVFAWICGHGENPSSFGLVELVKILTALEFPFTKADVEKMIWEVDQNLDGRVDRYEFDLMYKRCIGDKTGLEPRNLFNLVRFLMYDKSCRGAISVEDTLQLIIVRYKGQMNKMIYQIFEDKEVLPDGQERLVKFEEYLHQMRRRDMVLRKELDKARKKVSKPQSKKDD